MDKILSYEQYRERLARARASGYRSSNCFFLPAAVREKIAAGSLFFLSVENGLLLLEEQESFYRCYYFLSPDQTPAPLRLDRPAVIEFPYQGELNPRQLGQLEQIRAMGFRLGRESALMHADAEELRTLSGGDGQSPAAPASLSDAAEILRLFRDCFDPRYSFLPDEEELAAAICDGRVLSIRMDGQLAAALHSGFEKNQASIRQVAAAPAFRGRGLGKAIVQAYHEHYRGSARSFQHWVDLHNLPAVSLYQSFGYTFSFRKANEYIL